MVENVGEDSENVSRRKLRISTCHTDCFLPKSWSYGGLTVVLRWSYDFIWENHPELSMCKGTKNVRETSDIVGGEGVNRIHKSHKIFCAFCVI